MPLPVVGPGSLPGAGRRFAGALLRCIRPDRDGALRPAHFRWMRATRAAGARPRLAAAADVRQGNAFARTDAGEPARGVLADGATGARRGPSARRGPARVAAAEPGRDCAQRVRANGNDGRLRGVPHRTGQSRARRRHRARPTDLEHQVVRAGFRLAPGTAGCRR